jgi:alkylmercury lyase
VTIAQFAQAIGESVATAEGFVHDSGLSPFAHASDAGLIQGFWGLSTKPTPHQFTVKSRTLWTWCAYDSVFLPALLGEATAVESRDPESGQSIRLTVSPSRIEAAEPADIVVSMISPGAWDLTSVARVMASACHFIFFFASRALADAAPPDGSVVPERRLYVDRTPQCSFVRRGIGRGSGRCRVTGCSPMRLSTTAQSSRVRAHPAARGFTSSAV